MEQFIINKNKEEFSNIARENIKREGIEELLKWIESTDFFEAPASAKFHLAEAGGLCLHSINVFKRLKKLAIEHFEISPRGTVFKQNRHYRLGNGRLPKITFESCLSVYLVTHKHLSSVIHYTMSLFTLFSSSL